MITGLCVGLVTGFLGGYFWEATVKKELKEIYSKLKGKLDD